MNDNINTIEYRSMLLIVGVGTNESMNFTESARRLILIDIIDLSCS